MTGQAIFNHSFIILKKMISIPLFASISMLCCADDPSTEELKILYQEVQDLKTKYIELTKTNQPVDLQEVKSIDQSVNPLTNSINLNLYGMLRADASYQLEGGNTIFNRINKVDLIDQQTNNNNLYTTVSTTRLGLDIKFRKETKQDLSAKLEMDFRGGTNLDSARIRHAYINYGNWLVGQTTTNFVSNEFVPEMIDFGSPAGIGTLRTPMLKYSINQNENSQYAFALEEGRTDNRFPTLTAKIKHEFDQEKVAVSARGLLQELKIKEVDDQNKLSWGAAIGVSYKINKKLQLKGDYSYVYGDDTFMLYTNRAYVIANDKAALNEFNAFTLGLTYQLNPKLRNSLGYGAIFADKKNQFAQQIISNNDQTQNKNLQQIWLNFLYMPTSSLTFGLEYTYGERQTFLNQLGKDNRVNSMLRFIF